MAKSGNQKTKLLALLRIFEQQTDEHHPMTVQQLIAALAAQGILAERKSIYDDVEALQQFGLDIVVLRGRSNVYYLGERIFQLPELKLLVDAAQSAKFITEKKSSELIEKISSLASHHEAQLLRRQVHVQGRVKTMNESIYYNVDKLHTAITENRQIRFKYYEWAVDSKSHRAFTRRWRRGGSPYLASPWAMVWDNENYYLIAYDEEAGIIKHYRADKMADIEIAEQPRAGRTVFESIDLAAYTKSTFGMFGGVERDVRIRFANHLVGVVVDRFGKNIIIHPEGEEHFIITIKAVVSPQFISWVLGFGNEAQVLAPTEVLEEIKQTLAQLQAVYQ